jgi:hypothetical protein
MKDKSKRLIPDSKVCQRYGVVPYTLWRWDHDPDSDFPGPVRINGRKYRVEEELDQFDARRAAERDARLEQRKQSNEAQPLDAGEATV